MIPPNANSGDRSAGESAKAVRLLKGDHRLVLTGTPVENRMTDLWSLFEFLNPGMLGSASVFRASTAGKDNGSDTALSSNSAEILSKALRPFILRRTKEQVATELPPKTEQTIYCELDQTQRRLYDELRAHYRESLLGRIEEMGIEKSRMHILEALLRLSDAGLRVEEVPVRMEPRAGGVSKFRGRKAVKVIGTVIGTLVAARLLRGRRSD